MPKQQTWMVFKLNDDEHPVFVSGDVSASSVIEAIKIATEENKVLAEGGTAFAISLADVDRYTVAPLTGYEIKPVAATRRRATVSSPRGLTKDGKPRKKPGPKPGSRKKQQQAPAPAPTEQQSPPPAPTLGPAGGGNPFAE